MLVGGLGVEQSCRADGSGVKFVLTIMIVITSISNSIIITISIITIIIIISRPPYEGTAAVGTISRLLGAEAGQEFQRELRGSRVRPVDLLRVVLLTLLDSSFPVNSLWA